MSGEREMAPAGRRSSLVWWAAVISLTSGCLTGPVRYKTLGHKSFVTAELAERAHPALWIVVVPVGLAADLVVVALDTVATPVVSIPIAFELMGPDPKRSKSLSDVGTKLLFSPIWFPISYPMCLFALGFPIEHPRILREWFGDEGTMFAEDELEAPSQGKADSCDCAAAGASPLTASHH